MVWTFTCGHRVELGNERTSDRQESVCHREEVLGAKKKKKKKSPLDETFAEHHYVLD